MSESGGRPRNEVLSKQPSTASFGKERIMFLRLLRLCCFGFLALTLVSSPAFSQGKGKGHNKGDDDQGPGKGNKKAKHEFNALMDSRSRWFVGSSRTRKFGFCNISLQKMSLADSPPERALVGLRASSPLKSI